MGLGKHCLTNLTNECHYPMRWTFGYGQGSAFPKPHNSRTTMESPSKADEGVERVLISLTELNVYPFNISLQVPKNPFIRQAWFSWI